MNSAFDYTLDYSRVNFREQPGLYRMGKGEQGVLLVEPYKSELLPHWAFRTPAIARKSARALYRLFLQYRRQRDFAGMDMARKFIQMGYTRARRYANHRSGRKYDGPVPADKKGQSGAHGRKQLPRVVDEEKAQSAAIFYETWQKLKADSVYQRMVEEHKKKNRNT